MKNANMRERQSHMLRRTENRLGEELTKNMRTEERPQINKGEIKGK